MRGTPRGVPRIFDLWIRSSRIYPANFGGFGDTGHGQQVRAHAQVAILFLRFVVDGLVGARHDALQLAVDLLFGPEEALQVLYPFKVADGHTSGVGEDIRDDGCTAIAEGVIGIKPSGTVGR